MKMMRDIRMKHRVSRETFSRILSFSLVLLVSSIFLFSCGVSYTDDDVKNAVRELVPRSMELNDIYFGEGLPIADNREDVERFYAMFEGDVESVNYHPVAKDCKYQTIDDIKKATEAVFTPDYAKYLYELAFNGLSVTFNEGTELQTVETAAYARYIETNGVLTVRIDLPYEAMELTRTYDFERIEVILKTKHYAIVSVPTKKDGAELEIKLHLTVTPDGFRLDTPTY